MAVSFLGVIFPKGKFSSDVNKDLTFKAKDQDKDQTPKDNYGASSPRVYFCPSEMPAFASQ